MVSPRPRAFYAGVFVISGLLMTVQIIQSRIFSVTTWYHLSFLVISVAMFGLTLGALKVHRAPDKQERYAEAMANGCFGFGTSILIALAAQLSLPLVSDDPLVTVISLPLISLITLAPYYYAGIVLTLAITRAPFPVGRTYGADLLGAATGCLFALGVMSAVDAPSAIIIVALLAFATSFCFARTDAFRTSFLSLLAILALAFNLAGNKPLIYPYYFKDHHIPESRLAYDHWNSISRVMVEEERKNAPPYLWGPSIQLPPFLKTSWYELLIDGDASTPITKWSGKDRGRELAFLDYDVTTIAYALPELKSAGIIGLGGGRDVLSALHAGISSVTALDVNAVQVDLLTRREPFRSYAHISDTPGVRLIHHEARSWFAGNPDKFDLIQMSLVDTWASTGAGAFTLSENGLYTVDAWKTFLDHLNPHGALTVSRWYLSDAQCEGERLLSLAVGSLFAEGINDPSRHIFMATSWSIATLVLSRAPFTPAQLDALEKRSRAMEFTVLASPRKTVASGEFAAILRTKNRTELEQLAQHSAYDISPPTDERPFFFNQVRLSDPIAVWRLAFQSDRSAMVGHAHAILNLYIIILFSVVMVFFTILLPLRTALKNNETKFIGAGTAWFALIGLGFMLTEISLVQRMSVYLGHPAYGLGIVLFSLVLSTGCGSLMSERLPLVSSKARVAWALVTAASIIAAVFIIEAAMDRFADAGLFGRAAVCLSLTLPLGCLMGFGFPTGMAIAKKENPYACAWFWGINGAASVMGSSLAIAVNIAAGADRAMFLAALCYALLVFAALRNQPVRKYLIAVSRSNR